MSLVLIILDGWGYNEAPEHNAIFHAKKPYWDSLLKTATTTTLLASGEAVGLPDKQMGNSEVGHLNIGAGRVVPQDFTRIQQDIYSDRFEENATLTEAIELAMKTQKAVHILGLLSPGGVHSHETHLHAMVKLAAHKGARDIYVHAFLDGRDTPPRSAKTSIEKMEAVFKEVGRGKIASLIGRYYAMDRDHRWERVKAAFDLLTKDDKQFSAESAMEGLELAYARDESDEFVKATHIHSSKETPKIIQEGDVVIFMNYRADRARELTEALNGKAAWTAPKIHLVTLTQYDETFDLPAAYQPLSLKKVLGEVLSEQGLHQLRLAETEKYAHVTFFFNGGNEIPFAGEERLLIPSPKVATYDLQPEMSAPALTDALVAAIYSKKYEVIICNYANPDMVGHTGDFNAAVKACEVIDACLLRVGEALKQVKGEMIITADHGNVECMHDENTGQAHTAHTNGPVPFVYVGRPAHITTTEGALCDIAPTMLMLLGLKVPSEMTGQCLITFS